MDQLRALLQTVLVETDYKLAVVCFLDLASVYHDRQIAELLVGRVSDPTFIVRLRAVQFIGLLALADRVLLDTIIEALEDRSWIVREAAIGSLVRIAKDVDEPALQSGCRQALLDRALTDVHATIRAQCILELSRLGSPHDVPKLVVALQSGSSALQIRALRVCEGVNAYALGALCEIECLMESSHAKKRLRAVAACQNCLNKKTILLLIRRLFDGDQRVRALARSVLMRTAEVIDAGQRHIFEIILSRDTALQSIEELLHSGSLTDDLIADFKELRTRRMNWRTSHHEDGSESDVDSKWYHKEAVWQLVYLVDKILGVEGTMSVVTEGLSASHRS